MTLEIDKKEVEEKRIRAKSGMGILILPLLLMAVSIAAAVFGILFLARERFALVGISQQKDFLKGHDLKQ